MATFRVGDLVWAQLSGHPWWPAVIFESTADEGRCVRFFGQHTRAQLKKVKLRPYGKQDLLYRIKAKNNSSLQKAITEADLRLDDIGEIVEPDLDSDQPRSKPHPPKLVLAKKSEYTKKSEKGVKSKQIEKAGMDSSENCESEKFTVLSSNNPPAKDTTEEEPLNAYRRRTRQKPQSREKIQRPTKTSDESISPARRILKALFLPEFKATVKNLQCEIRNICVGIMFLLGDYIDSRDVLRVLFEDGAQMDKSIPLYYQSPFRNLFQNIETEDLMNARILLREHLVNTLQTAESNEMQQLILWLQKLQNNVAPKLEPLRNKTCQAKKV